MSSVYRIQGHKFRLLFRERTLDQARSNFAGLYMRVFLVFLSSLCSWSSTLRKLLPLHAFICRIRRKSIGLSRSFCMFLFGKHRTKDWKCEFRTSTRYQNKLTRFPSNKPVFRMVPRLPPWFGSPGSWSTVYWEFGSTVYWECGSTVYWECGFGSAWIPVDSACPGSGSVLGMRIRI